MRFYVYACPYCGRQYRAPGGHHMAGDDLATSCFHRHPGERGVSQPKLVRVEVEPVELFTLRPIPHDGAAASRRVKRSELKRGAKPMKRSPMKKSRPRRLSEAEREAAWMFKLSVLNDPCAACGLRMTVRLEAHHVLSQQKLRDHAPDRVWDEDNALSLCSDCHERHTNASRRILRSCLRPENEAFAEELGLTHLLDRYYPSDRAFPDREAA